jgi:hypothetical protein
MCYPLFTEETANRLVQQNCGIRSFATSLMIGKAKLKHSTQMRDVVVAYGEFKDYKLPELPDSFLGELTTRFPLESDKHQLSSRHDLFITVAIHQEIQRRRLGGAQAKHRPTKKRLAEEIITKGFHHLSKTHHPDRNGDNEIQKTLTSARDFLHRACKEIQEDYDDETILVDAPVVEGEITDEDIPF